MKMDNLFIYIMTVHFSHSSVPVRVVHRL